MGALLLLTINLSGNEGKHQVKIRGLVLNKEVWERRFHKRGFPTPLQKEMWECRSHTK